MNKFKKKQLPLISIVTPSYNQGQFIEETILSVKNQDYDNIEHIIIDGESTDNTLNLLKNYEDEYNLKWISEEDKGQSDAINKGFEIAQGDIIGWLNSDDLYFDTQVFSIIADKFLNSNIDIVYGHAAKINAKNKIMKLAMSPKYNYEFLKRWCYIIQPTVFFKSDVCKENKLNTELNYSLDYEFWLRLGKEYQWKLIDKIIAVDRNHSERKIIKEADISTEETKKLRSQFECSNLRLIIDRVIKLYKNRLEPISKIFSLYHKDNYVFDVELPNILKFIFNQLFIDDKELV